MVFTNHFKLFRLFVFLKCTAFTLFFNHPMTLLILAVQQPARSPSSTPQVVCFLLKTGSDHFDGGVALDSKHQEEL
jgi:hypothetical protein